MTIIVNYSVSNNHQRHDNFQPHLTSALADEPGHAPPVILLIDDEESFQCVIKQVLVNAGFEVVEAANGAQGIQ